MTCGWLSTTSVVTVRSRWSVLKLVESLFAGACVLELEDGVWVDQFSRQQARWTDSPTLTCGIRRDIQPESVRSDGNIAIPVARLEVRHRSAHWTSSIACERHAEHN